jgi:hypothetical protein
MAFLQLQCQENKKEIVDELYILVHIDGDENRDYYDVNSSDDAMLSWLLVNIA